MICDKNELSYFLQREEKFFITQTEEINHKECCFITLTKDICHLHYFFLLLVRMLRLLFIDFCVLSYCISARILKAGDNCLQHASVQFAYNEMEMKYANVFKYFSLAVNEYYGQSFLLCNISQKISYGRKNVFHFSYIFPYFLVFKKRLSPIGFYLLIVIFMTLY